MEKVKNNKFLIILFGLLLILLFIVLYFKNKEETENYYESSEDITLKNYKENEYIPVNITYDQMARIYLQDYVKKLIYDKEAAYNLLDSDYRNKKFSTYESFLEYIDIIMTEDLKKMVVDHYAFTSGVNANYYDVYDLSDNLFIFKEVGVMQYTVYFDRYTTEIK